MSERTETESRRTARLILAAARAGKLKKAVFSKPSKAEPLLWRAVATVRMIGKEEKLQIETFQTDNKAVHENLSLRDEERLEVVCLLYGQVNILTSCGDGEYKSSKSGNGILIGGDQLERALQSGVGETIRTQENNREKKHILRGDEPFLRYLGVSDEKGRVYDKKQSKFRQINRFLELVRDVEDRMPAEGTLHIYDLCCGKSYLSFAVYHYFAILRKRSVEMVGMDLKSDVMAFCAKAAQELRYDGLHFFCGDVAKIEKKPDERVDMVISLHACDIATDIVLDKAVEWQAELILSTPCCHHELNRVLQCPEMSFIAEHSMLKQKFCDAATDALRLKRLEAAGYETAALELIDPEETPKNILLRGIRKKNFSPDSPEGKRAAQEYEIAKKFLIRVEKETFL